MLKSGKGLESEYCNGTVGRRGGAAFTRSGTQHLRIKVEKIRGGAQARQSTQRRKPADRRQHLDADTVIYQW